MTVLISSILLFHVCSVPGPVSGLSVTPEVVQLTISWSPPSEPNVAIIAYEVCSNNSGVFSYTNTSATQLILRDLPPNTVVAFSVRAYTCITGPGENVTGQASTGSVREYNYKIKTSFHILCCAYPLSNCYWSVSSCSEQHSSEGILDSSQPDSGGPLHCTLYYSGRGQWHHYLPSECLLWSGVRTAGRTAVPVQCYYHT